MTCEQAVAERQPMKVSVKGNLSEIYLSLQGEGIWVGIPMVIVRMTGCHRRCRYCDTEFALVAEKRARIWLGWRRGEPKLTVDNPITAQQVAEWVLQASGQGNFANWVSFTGGEPLLQAEFLAELGAMLKGLGFRILLETEGGLPDRLEKVLPFVDAVAADIKLPSTTGEPLDWVEAERFLRLVAEAPVQACVKIVVTTDIDESEFERAVELLAQLQMSQNDFRKLCPMALILQPVTPARFVTETPSAELLMRLASLAQQKLVDVRIVPQVHKLMQLP
ncbi:7-carboxy-7-deazaguanine synthase QueE [Fervidibacter sacchari]|mgnify:CR=1 FL=1|uniref:7-carboxy-7-deazaguanine synthase n=1 Tax=Candidatus Fervidibacter sacchari TaxID=1448929 RepID=A0ABT2ENK3_9BACT|nr:7-carboxy-7-deazaguanine synthase QueE [Candidatus Fervidibacter sacchari]MCS3918493.1 organic radical activating enzyme [Candidatus Fervidibacter sacchari]WKU17738.1 7-carboxy-7-deazaguanine synthase QueE [Candidatus Fervidibacter sacchari]